MITDLRKRPTLPLDTLRSGLAPWLALGFRPFFLLAGLLATSFVPLWLFVFAGKLALPTRLFATSWHAHEMVFGFATAAIAGFLLTAVRNWTGRPTPSGAPLGALVVLWVLGRAAILLYGVIPRALTAAIDLSFIPCVAFAVAIPIVKAKNWKNLGFVPLLLGLFASDLLFFAGSPRWVSLAPKLAIDIILMVTIVVGGRVIPSFTANALGVTVRRRPLLDWGSLAAMGTVAVLELIPDAGKVAGIASIVAGAVNGARMAGWHPQATRKQPILWVLHAGYAWIAIGLVLQGIAAFVPQWIKAAPTHALTVGAISTLVLGMTSRVSLGHTGRMLAVPRSIVAAYVLLTLAAVLRAFGPIVAPAAYMPLLVASGTLWTLAFGVFTAVYFPILTSPRVDGKPG